MRGLAVFHCRAGANPLEYCQGGVRLMGNRMKVSETYLQGRLSLVVSSAGDDQVHLTACVSDPVEPAVACRQAYVAAARALEERGAEPVHERVFGSLTVRQEVAAAREAALTESGLPARTPFTYIQGHPLWGEGFAGFELYAVRPERQGAVWTIGRGGVAWGRGWQRKGARFLLLHSVHGRQDGRERQADRTAETCRMFSLAHELLRENGASYSDVVTTWIYLSDILAWYDEFNQARNASYRKMGLMPERRTGPLNLPASTGIRGENPYGAWAVMDVMAVTGEPGIRPKVSCMSNVKQNEAYDYGSAFSRGICVEEADVTHLMISGTAAIDEQGRSMFPGDARAQVARTLETVEALIAPRGADLNDICEATVFLKRPEDEPAYREVMRQRGLEQLPAVCVVADVCRDELLFEMDATAMLERRAPSA